MSLVRRMDLGVAVIEGAAIAGCNRRRPGAWLVTSLAILFALQWPEIVRVNAGLANWVLLDELVILSDLAPLPHLDLFLLGGTHRACSLVLP